MSYSTRLIIGGFWGEPDPPAIPFNVTSDRAWAGIVARGHKRNIRRYRKHDKDDGKPGDNDGKEFDTASAIGIDYRNVFDSQWSTKAQWAQSQGESADFVELTDGPCGKGINLGFENATTNTASSFTTLPLAGEHLILENGAVALRFYLFKPPKTQNRSVWTARWARYQFQIIDGKPVLMRLKQPEIDPNTKQPKPGTGWSQTREDELNDYLALEDITADEQEAIDDLRLSIYEDYQELSFNVGSDGWYNAPHTLTFIPEPCGQVSVIHGETSGKTIIVEHSAIKKTREDGVLWDASPLTIRCEGGAYIWQPGYPEFLTPGEMRLWHFKHNHDVIAAVVAPGQPARSLIDGVEWASRYTLMPGTNLTFEVEAFVGDWAQIVVKFTTTNPRYTPFLYTLQAILPAGERNGGGTSLKRDIVWDSKDHPQDGNSPVVDIEPNFESDSHDIVKRYGYTVSLRDPGGPGLRRPNIPLNTPGYTLGLNFPGSNYEAAENRLTKLELGGSTVLDKAVVKRAYINNMGRITPNQPRIVVNNPDTIISLEIADMWELLMEDEMEDDPIGDGMRLGAYIRRILRGAGVKDSEMTGVSASAGRLLPRAAHGETPCIRPSGGSRGGWLQEIVDKWGMGLRLFCRTGIWTLIARTSPYQRGGIEAEFTSTHNVVGGFCVREPLDLTRDDCSTFNYFKVTGGNDIEGLPIVDAKSIPESTRGHNNPTLRGMMGRVKKKIVKDTGLRTYYDVNWVRRSLQLEYGRPGRFAAFKTYFHPYLYPGAFITIDTNLYQIYRIMGGSLLENEMDICAQEFIDWRSLNE